MSLLIQTRPRGPLNDPPNYVQIIDPILDTYVITLVKADATDFFNHTIANPWLNAHPELLPGILFVKWVDM